MVDMNVFRVLADVSHTVSKCILIWAIHSNRSAEGVSLLTQIMYIQVFASRYLDLFSVLPSKSYWNFSLKVFYITSSVYIIFLMLSVFARTREREKAWKLAAYINLGAILMTPAAWWVDETSYSLQEIFWTYSVILEAFCVLPQLILLRQTTVPTVIDSFYLVTLGSYRGFYLLNWIWQAIHAVRVEPVKIVFGVIQTAFYIDFAWVYYSRQRVKLRAGGIVDADDLRKGFLVNRFADHRTSMDDEEATTRDTNSYGPSAGVESGKKINRWGNRGISISADDTLAAPDRTRAQHGTAQSGSHATNGSDEDNDAFLSDEDEDAPILGAVGKEALNSGSEWHDDTASRT